jgi:hypothetical protein
MPRTALFLALLLASGFVAAAPPHVALAADPAAMTITAPAHYTAKSYRGQPDLGLTVALVDAGGGAQHFDAHRLLVTLAGPHTNDEVARLRKLYGKAKVDAFMQTFTFSVVDLLEIFRLNHIALPAQPRIRPSDGRAIAMAVYHDGIMSNGRYDCGYMMEHLMTHPVHVVLMRDIDNQRGHGPRHNANYHEMLTRVVLDLKNIYRS